ncbi:MAG: Eco57I restriction-modification methylase domain-containing protein, partial [Thiomargarita sp.]|nr:Eco57I restriction-modification methylase domain-containing protein [Thiomargarita sp.]
MQPKQILNSAFLKLKSNRCDIDKFKLQLTKLVGNINSQESEEFHKNLLIDFLQKTYYQPKHFINTKGRADLVIHNGKQANSTVGVIIELKRPTNKAEMLQQNDINKKALQELVLYYLRERITANNLEIKHLIVTNIYEWFIFDATCFERELLPILRKPFLDFEAGRLSGITTDFFYRDIARVAIAKVFNNLEFTYFDIRDYQSDELSNELIYLFKLLSPEHLLKLPFINDSNSLNKNFYAELLHIIGLREIKKSGKKLLELAGQSGSLLDNIITELRHSEKLERFSELEKFGTTEAERLFNIGLELVITWINRILFLKLLEAQLISYHDKTYAFLDSKHIKNFHDLNDLFFQVLARTKEERIEVKFNKVPYLNSSLFEATEIEHNFLFISQLASKSLALFSHTVLKDVQGEKRIGELDSLEYLFAFLEAYDFASEGSAKIQEENKSLINASVLGLIFEKINGYRDGSFFTPGFITMYMCRETIRRAVVQKFNQRKGWNCQNLDDLYNKVDDQKEANAIINELKICDPAVGSGHFLVSALNELLVIKHELRILQDCEGKRLKEYTLKVVNDELIVKDEDGELFAYHPKSPESQRVQAALFHEKQNLIENCLFGVDINTNSVKICRLRLWIELLKHAYYKADGELETLPNIDINIKCGNSLISRFDLEGDLSPILRRNKWSIEAYKNAVATYRNAVDKTQKREMERLITDIKTVFRTEISRTDSKLLRLNSLREDLGVLLDQVTLFVESAKEKKAKEKRQKQLEKEIAKLEVEVEDIRTNRIYQNAFEWRFEFPEVLNEKGDFVGFDVVIGNPPYIRQEAFSALKPFLKQRFNIYHSIADLLTYFVELSYYLLKQNGHFQFIVSNKFTRANYGKAMRRFLLDKTAMTHFIDFSGLSVFDEATVDAAIVGFKKDKSAENSLIYADVEKSFDLNNFASYLSKIKQNFVQSNLTENSWAFESSEVLKIKQKIEAQGIPLKDWDISIKRGILTGYNKAFIIDKTTKEQLISEDPKSEEVLKPILRGRDIQKYYPDFQNLWLIYIPWHFPLHTDNTIQGVSKKAEKELEKQYPAIYKHLLKHKDKLSKRNKAETNIRYEWYALQRFGSNYWQNFEKPKIIYRDIAQILTFTLDHDCFYTNNTNYFIIGDFDLKYLLASLNSKLFDFYYRLISTQLGNNAVRLFSQFVEQIPVKQISKKQEQPFVKKV